MKVKSLLFTFAVCLLAAAPAIAQQGGGQPAPPSVTIMTGGGSGSATSAYEGMGVRKYMLGPGDRLDLRVFNEAQFNGTLVVDDEGKVFVPFIDEPINAQCRTDREIRKEIVEKLSKYLKRPQVSLHIAEMRSRPAAVVFGAVRNPTPVDMRRRARLLEVLSVAGSVTEQASGDIQIFHTTELMCPEPEDLVEMANQKKLEGDALALPYSIYKISELRAGKKEANPVVRPGDIVIVQEAYPVYVTGAVVAPNSLYLRENLSLSLAIAQVGGARKGAETNKVRIIRPKPGVLEPEIIVVSLDDIKKKKRPDFALKPYDIIDVSDGSPWSWKNIPNTLLSFATGGASTLAQTVPVRIIQ